MVLIKYNPLFKQLIRFGIVGCAAAAVNMLVVIALVELKNWHPLIANILAFIIAFQVSYFGHQYWSFKDQNTCHQFAVPRFALVAIISFLLNEGLFFLFLSILQIYYIISLLLVLLIVPSFTFFCSKCWAFKSA